MDLSSNYYESKGGYGYSKRGVYPVLERELENGKVLDTAGHSYYDWMSGCCTCPWGTHPKIVKAIQDQAAKLIQYYDYQHDEREKLTRNFREFVGADYNLIYTVTGSQAVSIALRLAMFNKMDKSIPIYITESAYHGELYSSCKLLNRDSINKFYPDMHNNIKRVGTELDIDLLEHDSILLIEPYESANNGNYIRSDAELEAILYACHKKNILVIFDEIQTGMGRTGDLFISSRLRNKPDFIIAGKCIANGLPLSVVLYNNTTVADWEGSAYSSTFAANPIACAAGNAVFDLLRDKHNLQDIQAMGAHLKIALCALFIPAERHRVHARGLYVSVHIGTFDNKKVLQYFKDAGVILRYGSGCLILTPKYRLSRKEIDIVVGKIGAVLQNFCSNILL